MPPITYSDTPLTKEEIHLVLLECKGEIKNFYSKLIKWSLALFVLVVLYHNLTSFKLNYLITPSLSIMVLLPMIFMIMLKYIAPYESELYKSYVEAPAGELADIKAYLTQAPMSVWTSYVQAVHAQERSLYGYETYYIKKYWEENKNKLSGENSNLQNVSEDYFSGQDINRIRNSAGKPGVRFPTIEE